MTEQLERQSERPKEKGTYYLEGLFVGGVVGIAGIFFGNLLMGIELGMAAGLLIGAQFEKS